MKFIAEYSLHEDIRRKGYFVICLITCFLVSLVCLVAKTIINQGSLIFLMLGEKESGEIDFYIQPISSIRNYSLASFDDYHRDYSFINLTKYGEIMNEQYKKKFHKDEIYKNPYDTSSIRTYINGYTANNQIIYLLLIDSEREKKMELGRSYPYGKLKEGECLVHEDIIHKNNEISIAVSLKSFLIDTLLYFYHDSKEKSDPNLKYLDYINTYVTFKCKVAGTFKDNYGKEASDDSNIIIMEQEFFYHYISNYISNDLLQLFPDYPQLLKNIRGQEYGNVLVINFPKNRLNYYTGDDYDDLLDKGVKFMNEIIKKMGGFQNFRLSMPLIQTMNKYKYGTTMLNLILNLILLGIFGLSLILIHSLLLITTETNSFEFGILRLVGNSKKYVIYIILFECICFSIPAFIVAFVSSFGVLKIINNKIKNELQTDLNLSVTFEGFFYSFILNFLAPIIAAIFPIRNILKKNIATSINTMINKTQGVKVEIISLQKKELTSLIVFGIITFIYGSSIYYFLPLSLISLNFGMIGGIFLWILFGILLGFVFLSRNIEMFLQKILTYTILFFTKNYTKIIILKNLTAHRIKNKKTSLMFSLSVGIFIMISVGFDLILQSATNMIIMRRGSEIEISVDDEYFTPNSMINAFIELYDKKLIDSFAFKSGYLNDICDSSFYISNYGKNIPSRLDILTTTSDYLRTTDKNDLKKNEERKEYSKYSPTEQLYFSKLKGKVGISAILKFEFNANLESQIFLKFLNGKDEMLFLSKPGFILDSAGGLTMNSQPSMFVTRDALISIPMYLDILQKCKNYFFSSSEDVVPIYYHNLPIRNINIKPKEHSSVKEINKIAEIIRREGPDGKYWFFENMKDRLDTVSNIVYLIFYCVSCIVLIFCLFNLMASMTINIFEQKKEIAILRSLGTQRRHVIFIYVAESIILILSSSIIGSIIGCIISYTMAKQWEVFTNINISFSLPTGSIIIVICLSIFGGIISTLIPAKNMLNNSISQLIKLN